ncbi:MAG: peptidoglycan-binding protein LysM [Tunicatimonas sp.]|uniref:peptidoglycan-binding protein LysM n=1 Tax=Tunicatimonas sp. TaxID=1940096 RepID=UPI003C733380
MGLIDFFKNAGDKLFGRETDEEKQEKLMKHVKSLGLPVEGLSISVDDETVTVKGKVDSVAHSEKIALAVGNVEGVSKVDNQIKVEKPAPQATYHTVEKGDSLSKIAKEVYGDPMKYPAIFDANKPMLKDPDKIYPGQVLRIPPKETLA